MSCAVDVRAAETERTVLASVLTRLLSRHFGRPCPVVEVERRQLAYSSSFAIDELALRLGDGARLELLLKDLGRDALLSEARRTKPAFLYDPLREIETYRRILATRGLGTARCYGAVVSRRAGRYWLFLEKVAGPRLCQVGEFGTWQQVARWLAQMHGALAPMATPASARSAHLLRYDAAFYRLWPRRALAFARLPRGVRHRLERLVGGYERVIERLVALPTTFIHGEFYAPNILIDGGNGALRVCPIDWELAAVGPGLIDLATLTAGRWTDGEKASLAQHYREALAPEARGALPADAFAVGLDCCRLHLAVQWLGWSPRWAVVRDWLAEALRVGERLGL